MNTCACINLYPTLPVWCVSLGGVVGRNLQEHGRERRHGRCKKQPKEHPVYALGQNLPLMGYAHMKVKVIGLKGRARAFATAATPAGQGLSLTLVGKVVYFNLLDFGL